MLKYFLAIAVLAGSVCASDVRIGVGVNIGVHAPLMNDTVIVERSSTLVWVPPVYEQRYDADGNLYLVIVRQGYYQQVVYQQPVYVAPRPLFSFGLFFGNPSYGPRFGSPHGSGPFHSSGGPSHRR